MPTADVACGSRAIARLVRLFAEATGSAFTYFLDPTGLENLRSYESRLEGTETVDGTLCDVVAFPLPGGGSYRLAFGRNDQLLRRYAFSLGGEAPERTEVTSFAEMGTDEDVAAGEFVIETEGLRVEAYAPAGLALGEPAPDFRVTGEDGRELQLSSLRGRVVVLDFWASWCGPCKPAMVSLQTLQADYADKPLQVVGLTWMESGDPAVFADSLGISYPVFRGDEVAASYGVPELGLPCLFVIGPAGRLLDYTVGYKGAASDRHLRGIVDRALGPA